MYSIFYVTGNHINYCIKKETYLHSAKNVSTVWLKGRVEDYQNVVYGI